MNERSLHLKSNAEFFVDAEESTFMEDVQEALRQEREAQGLIDLDQLRAMEDWSFLNDKIVGAEL